MILAAGYAVRMWPLTRDRPKPLLPIRGKPILDHLLERLKQLPAITEVIVVTNERFKSQFLEWNPGVTIITNGSTSVENKRGAIRDLLLGLEEARDDALILAGDNIIECDLTPLLAAFREAREPTIALLDVKEKALLRKRHGVALLEGGVVTSFEEKPEQPRSTLKSFLCYCFPKELRKAIKEYLSTHDADATGHFLEWLVSHQRVRGHLLSGTVTPVGTLEEHAAIQGGKSGEAEPREGAVREETVPGR